MKTYMLLVVLLFVPFAYAQSFDYGLDELNEEIDGPESDPDPFSDETDDSLFAASVDTGRDYSDAPDGSAVSVGSGGVSVNAGGVVVDTTGGVFVNAGSVFADFGDFDVVFDEAEKDYLSLIFTEDEFVELREVFSPEEIEEMKDIFLEDVFYYDSLLYQDYVLDFFPGEIAVNDVTAKADSKNVSTSLRGKDVTVKTSNHSVVLEDSTFEIAVPGVRITKDLIQVEGIEIKLPSEINQWGDSLENITYTQDRGKPLYDVDVTIDERLLGLFSVSVGKEIVIDAATGEQVSVSGPWWDFLAFE